MDKLSFTFVYRTAAILDAFSHLDALRDEPLRQGSGSVVGAMPRQPLRMAVALRHLAGKVRRAAGQLLSRGVPRRAGLGTEATGKGGIRRPVGAGTASMPRPGVPLDGAIVSHFAFCDQTVVDPSAEP